MTRDPIDQLFKELANLTKGLENMDIRLQKEICKVKEEITAVKNKDIHLQKEIGKVKEEITAVKNTDCSESSEIQTSEKNRLIASSRIHRYMNEAIRRRD
jgi:septal ring factor EnvC (AmiA/AmiB activator)